ncbi:hypothetical protein C028_01834 [Brucella abortus 63/168]|nr:hypothetical protein C028_01834 [Brucella abortus 63/168]
MSKMTCTAVLANSLVPRKLASEVAKIRNGNSAIRPERAMWLAKAQPSSVLKCPHTSKVI